MVNRELVLDRISIIKNSLKRLKEISELSKQEFIKNDDYFATTEHHLRRALEAVLDLGRHICVKEDFGQPQDYTEVFDILNSGGVLSKEFTESIRGMAGYRNRLVHMYNQVDKEEIYQILQQRLDDFETFIEEVMNYINND